MYVKKSFLGFDRISAESQACTKASSTEMASSNSYHHQTTINEQKKKKEKNIAQYTVVGPCIQR